MLLWEIAVIFGTLQLAKSECPNGCLCTTQSIDCSSRKLTTFPHDLSFQIYDETIDSPIPDTKTTTSLNLAHNQLTEWQGKLLSNSLPNLVSLDLSNNKIAQVTSVQTILFSSKLLHLKLSYNPIQNLGHNVDSVLLSNSIYNLDISYCEINSIINSESIMFLTNLTHLSLSGNPLFVIDNLHSGTLIHLDLSGCFLGIKGKGIREEAFKNLPQLKYLNVSMNSNLIKFSSTRPLSFSLTCLEASNCAFENPDLRLFPNLRQVVMKRNVIKTLHNEALSHNSRLESLDVSENSIHQIEERALVGSSSLKKLDLSQNFLSSLNWDIFLQTPKLEVLNVSRNLFKSLDEIPLPSLVVLDASRCEIFKLSPGLLGKTYNLIYLNLSHNFIESLPQKLSSEKLRSLDLSFCRISDLKPESFQELPSLRKLNLMGNRLTNPLNESLLHQLEHVKELNLLDNPWHCDCSDSDFAKVWQYLSLYPTKISQLKNLICHSPKEHAGMSWESSCYRILGTNKKSKTGAWYSFLVPFLTVCCMMAIFVVIRQAYVSHGLEVEQREMSNQRTSRSTETRTSQRPGSHYFDEDFERGIQMSVNESTQRSPIHDLSKLPSYEEALLLPKLLSKDDLKSIIKNYEERDRFEQSTSDNTQLHCSENNECGVHSEESLNYPSTSRNPNETEDLHCNMTSL